MKLLNTQGRKFFPILNYCLRIKEYFSLDGNTFIFRDTTSKCVHSTYLEFLGMLGTVLDLYGVQKYNIQFESLGNLLSKLGKQHYTNKNQKIVQTCMVIKLMVIHIGMVQEERHL